MQTSPEVLHQDLADFRVSHPNLTLLQYVDDILLKAETEQECLQVPAISGTQRLWYKFMKKLLASSDPSYELPVVVVHTGILISSAVIQIPCGLHRLAQSILYDKAFPWHWD
ncbi:hypothetical protein STEG23_031747 [Scotinomys teguina]